MPVGFQLGVRGLAYGLVEAFEYHDVVDGGAIALDRVGDVSVLPGSEGGGLFVGAGISQTFQNDDFTVGLALHEIEDIFAGQCLVDEFDEGPWKAIQGGNVIADVGDHDWLVEFGCGVLGRESCHLFDVESLDFRCFNGFMRQRDAVLAEYGLGDFPFGGVAGGEGEVHALGL